MCGSQNKNVNKGRKTIKDVIETNDTQNLQTQETNNEILLLKKTKLNDTKINQAVDIEKKTISNDTKKSINENNLLLENNQKKEDMCLIS